MPLPIVNTYDFYNDVEAEYPIGKYKNGTSKMCCICNKKFYVGQSFVNSSKPIIDRKNYATKLELLFGKDVANDRLSKMTPAKPTIIHAHCRVQDDDRIVNLICSKTNSIFFS